MEDMDIDKVIDVPDTPDRLASKHIIGRGSANACTSSFTGNFRNLEPMNGLTGKGELVTENGHGRKIIFRPPKFGIPERQDCSNSNGFSSAENSSAPLNTHLFRRAAVEKNHGHKAKHSIGAPNLNQGKSLSKFPTKSSMPQEGSAFFDLTEHNSHTQHPRKVSPYGESKYPVVKESHRGQTAAIGDSSVTFISDSLNTSRNDSKGKGKIDDNTFKGPAFGMFNGKNVNLSADSPRNSGELMHGSHPVTSPRVSGQKRLVRNGCISPLNIEAKAKQLDEQQRISSKKVEQVRAGNAGSDCSPGIRDTSDIVTEVDKRGRGKGKTIVIDPYASKECKTKFVQSSGTSHVIETGEANVSNDASGDVFGCSTRNGGWRSTRNPIVKVNRPLPDTARHLSSRTDGNGINCMTESDHAEDRNAVQTVSLPVSDREQTTRPPRAGKIIIKRQKKQGSASMNNGECSTLISDEPDIMLVGSSRGSSKSASSSIQNSQSRATSSSVIEIDELSPAPRNTTSQRIDNMNDDDSEARARQLEADEMLARELQEQLYNEGPIVGIGEIDEHLARALQQEEHGLHTFARSQNEPHARDSTMSHLYRQPRSRSSQNPSRRRGTQGQVPTSTRMAQLRNRFHRQSAAASTRATNLQFPLDMDLEMRLDILEALEAAGGDLSDVEMGQRASQIFRSQRDFNETDYEMLLALDENNHRHGGASVTQINSLPQSTVQTDALEEACAVCLETPTMGQIVRILPCLHKFHKDCIDPWLRRKTSCPVCKCSIT